MTRTSSLRLAALLLLAGQLLYIVVTLFHAGGDANHHHSVFTGYAHSDTWKPVHLAQFLAMGVMLAGLMALVHAVDLKDNVARMAGRFGAVMAGVALALYAVLQAVDGIALKQAVDAWVAAPAAEKAARFATAEGIRWLEWGVRSYHDYAVGLALLLFAVAVARAAWAPRAIAPLMGLAGLAYLMQGWVLGVEGFSQTETLAILLAYVLNLAWMVWLVVASRRMPRDEPAPAGSAA